MQVYRVGGFVRDTLLGIPPRDTDFVVIGATPNEMLARGFKKVGASFSVFLHPDTKEEYALGRLPHGLVLTEQEYALAVRKVTLEEDLSRRDLTINSIAMASDGSIIDPFGGRRDLEQKTLRHVSAAFSEDPLRVLRVARFHARYGDEWTVSEETKKFMSAIVGSSALDIVARERIWREMEKGLGEHSPELMLSDLRDVGFTEREAFAVYGGAASPHLEELRQAVRLECSKLTRALFAFPTLAHSKKAKECVPGEVIAVANALDRVLDLSVLTYRELSADQRVVVLEAADAFRVGTKFGYVLEALSCYDQELPAALRADLVAAKCVDVKSVLGDATDADTIRARLFAARCESIGQVSHRDTAPSMKRRRARTQP
jgi:tRNA nucleotidyltransferase (CCA-adding enzyme)